MQFPENIPKIPALIGIVILVAVAAVGAVTLTGLTDQTVPQQQGISDEEAQKIIDSENATQPSLDNVTMTEEPATAEEIEAFNRYAENEETSANAAYTTRVIYPVSQPSTPEPTQPESTQVIGGELVSDETTDPNDIPDDSAYDEPEENYDDDTPEYEDDEPIPDIIEIPTEDDDGYYSDDPYDPFDDDIFDDGDDEEESDEGEGDE